jgi:hypothetical protein
MRIKRKGSMPALALILALSGGATTAAVAAAPVAPAASDPAAAPDTPRERFRDHMRERIIERRAAIDRKLTSEQVRDIVAGRLALSGNPNLKVGKVTAKAEGVVAVDIVTKTGALVITREISTRTGGPVRADGDTAIRHRANFRDRSARGRGDRGRGGHERMGGGPGDGRGFSGGIASGARDLNLTVDQVKKLAEGRLIMANNPNLKIGAVKEKDADAITVDIVAADNSLVVQREINRHTGRPDRPGRGGEKPPRG